MKTKYRKSTTDSRLLRQFTSWPNFCISADGLHNNLVHLRKNVSAGFRHEEVRKLPAEG